MSTSNDAHTVVQASASSINHPASIIRRPASRIAAAALALFMLLAITGATYAAGPDLTVGSNRFTVDRTYTFNLGPTGLRGWIYKSSLPGEGTLTAEGPFQILVTAVGTGTPASSIIQTNDVILGVQAGGGTVTNFGFDTRKSLGMAIGDAEASNGILRLLVNRYGSTNLMLTLQLRLTNLAYSATAPYNCPKSTRILNDAALIVSNKGASSFGNGPQGWSLGMAHLAAGITNANLRNYARSSAPYSGWGYPTWQNGYATLFLSEYYLFTGDANVTPQISSMTIGLASGQSLYGTFGHGYAVHMPYNTNTHGSIGGYGPVNSCGIVGDIAIVMGKKCGVADPEIDPAIDRAAKFFSYYAGKGSIPYGEHEPGLWHGCNGKDGMSAFLFALIGNRPTETEFFTRMSAATANAREIGHTGQGFTYLWLAPAVSIGGTNALVSYIDKIHWQLDLNRRSDGSFAYDGQGDGSQPNITDYWTPTSYYSYDPTACYLLTYALPHRRIYFTGRNPNPTNTLSSTVVSNAIWAGDFINICTGYTTNQLLSYFSEYDPVVRHYAAAELAIRPASNTLVNGLIAMTTNADYRIRETACDALGCIRMTNALPTLCARLYDTNIIVRTKAAEALAAFGGNFGVTPVTYLTNMMTAFVTNAWDQFVVKEEDPIQIANGRLAKPIFMTWGATTIGIADTNLLYAASRVGMLHPDSNARWELSNEDWDYSGSFFNRLSWTHVQMLAPALVAAVSKKMPADVMWWFNSFNAVLNTFAKYRIEEGLPLAMLKNEMGGWGNDGVETTCMLISNTYRGAAISVLPTLYAWSNLLTSSSREIALINSAVSRIVNDPSPPTLTNFKKFTTMAASVPAITVPTTTNLTLSTFVVDIDGGMPAYTWTKASGPGTVTFTGTNNVVAASNCTATITTPGTYVLQARVYDSSINDMYLWPTNSFGATLRTYTNGYIAVLSNVTVQVFDSPFIDITNSTYFETDYNQVMIGGTNNAAVVGSMKLVSVTGAITNYSTTFAVATPWSVVVSNLVGNTTNLVTVSGTNGMGVATNDTIQVYRTPLPYLKITNTPPTMIILPSNSNTWRISGTNNAYVVGTMWWTNTGLANAGGRFGFTGGAWTTNVPLRLAYNCIYVYGTNYLGTVVSDMYTVVVGTPPVISITNPASSGTTITVASTKTTQYVAGTNNVIAAGNMTWSNSMVGGAQISSAPLWNFTVALSNGVNTVRIWGTNTGGAVFADTVNVYRAWAPYTAITNGNFTVPMGTSLATVGGTNNAAVVGFMTLQGKTGAVVNCSLTLPAATPWEATVTNLIAGATNFVIMTVTNVAGETMSATNQVYRRPIAVVAITNITGTISTTNTPQYIAGTNNALVVGGMWWTNSLGGGGVLDPAPRSWNFNANLWMDNGSNVITVSGTNSAGDIASATVTAMTPKINPTNFFWTNAVNGVWSRSGNWTNELNKSAPPPLAGYAFQRLYFNVGSTFTASNDLNDGFLLNQINFGGSSATLIGKGLTLTNDNGQLPQINNNGTWCSINNNLVLATNVTYAGGGPSYMRGVISGPGGLVMNGTWVLILPTTAANQTNSYAGGTTINSGVINYLNDPYYAGCTMLGTGPVTLNGGGLELQRSSANDMNTIVFNAGVIYENNGWGSSWGGPIILNTNANMHGTYAALSLYGPISGPGGIRWTDDNRLRLYGTNTYAGPTTVAVSGGQVEYYNSFSVAPGEMYITNGALVNIHYGDNATINVLYLNGLRQPDGTYGAPGSPATYQTNFFGGTGYGTITVSSYPYVAITNPSGGGSTFVTTNDTQQIAGINNPNVVGMWWDCAQSGQGYSLDPGPGIFSFSTPVYFGNNVIVVSSTNRFGELRADTVTVYRSTTPFVDITNDDFTVAMDVFTTTIGGTNLGDLGYMTLASVALGVTNYFASVPTISPWTLNVGNLVDGTTNVVTVTVTNDAGTKATDTIRIYRPQYVFVDITNFAGSITITNASVYVAGTNNVRVVGTLWWTNSLGGGGILAPGGWGFTTPLALGTNDITVSGTNTAGAVASDTVTVVRRLVGTGKDILTFGPGAVITGTNIQWTLPYGTVVTALAPTYTVSEFAVDAPPSGTARDFTTPKQYVVTAEDLSSNTYLVTVTVSSTSTNYYWTNIVGGAWSTAGNWLNPDALPGAPYANGCSFYNLSFNDVGTFTASNDFSDGFLLNQLNFGGSTVTLRGNGLTLTNDNDGLPQINNNGGVGVTINNNLLLATNVTCNDVWPPLNFKNVISGPGGLVVNGWLDMRPSGVNMPNTYAGGTILNSGHLHYANEGPFYGGWVAFGTGPVTLNGGQLILQRSTANDMNTIVFNAGEMYENNGFGAAWGGAIILNTNAWMHGYYAALILYGPISGPGGIRWTSNTLRLYGTNTYTGPTTIAAGVMDCYNSFSVPPGLLSISNGAVVNLNYGGSRVIDGLNLGGVPQSDGTYGSTNSLATNKSTYFGGTGIVNVLGPLMIDITNIPPTGTTVTNTTLYVAGTNNHRVVGGMTWTNTLAGTGGVLNPVPQAWSFVADLWPGYNTIVVGGTNAMGVAYADTAIVSRATGPYADITNANFTVAMDITMATIGGTANVGCVGGMTLASVAGGVTNYTVSIPVATSWSMVVSNLAAGITNFVTMTVTNGVGATSNDAVQIYRRPLGIVDITNIVGTIYTTNTVQKIAGTNNLHIVGGMVWSNSMGGGAKFNAGPTGSPTGWTFNVTLSNAANIITVWGTNTAGDLASDSVTVMPPSPSNDILSCTFGPLGNATISGTNITMIVLPYVSLTNLAPTFVISDYATINPASGTTNDFTTPKFYTVTSQSGSNKQYKVTVTTWPYSGSLYVLTTPQGANLPGSAFATNFPLLVRLSTNNFPFSQAQTSGSDIRFYLPNGSRLPHQVEEWNTNAGAAVWVLMPFIKGNTNQEFRMCWGLASATNESSGSTVFKTANGYACVMHLNRNVQDATGSSAPTNNGAVTSTAVIGSAAYNLTNGSISCANVTNFPAGVNPPSTSVIWLRVRDFGGWSMPLCWGVRLAYGWSTWEMQIGFWNSPEQLLPARLSCYGPAQVLSSTRLQNDRWYHVVYTTSNGTGKVYIDGQLDATAAGGSITLTNPQAFALGGGGDYDVDEMRISSLIRDADWIKMEYENQKILQTAVGPIVQPGTNFSASPASVTMNENTTTNFTAQAGGAIKLYWVYRKGGVDTLVAVDQTTFAYSPGRVTGAQSFSIQFRAVYASGIVLTSDIPVTVNDTIPDPAFTLLPSTNQWDGRSVMTVKTNISNWAALLASGYTNLNYTWTVDGVAATKVVTPGLMTLSRAQGSGPMTVTLVMDNGGALITNFVVVQVQEPTNEAWVVRTPDANEKPVHNQFYARDDSGYGTLYYLGTQSGTSPNAFLKVYTNGVLYTNIVQALVTGTYAFTTKIPAGLIQHTVEYGTGAVVLATVTNIVCGDAYLVDGQSNAVTAPEDGGEPTQYTNFWIRTYGLTAGWGYGFRDGTLNENKIGHWQMDVASNLVVTCQMPICIINGAVGGTRIDVHLPNPANHYDMTGDGYTAGSVRNYGRLLTRVANAKLTHGIRGFFWHQGENNSGADGPDPGPDYMFYKQYFVDMMAYWVQDCPNLRNYFVYQVYPAPCSMGPSGDQLREVQRTLPTLYSPRMRVTSTVGLPGYAGCHYYRYGYYNMAQVMIPLVKQDIYGAGPTATNTAANLRTVSFTSASQNQLALDFGQTMLWNSSAATMFYLDGVGGKVTSGSVTGSIMYLQLSGYSTNATITYLDDLVWNQTETNRLLYGANGFSALTFADVPISPSTPPPFVDITNADFTVGAYITNTIIGGTNNATAVGSMRLVSMTGAITNYSAAIAAATLWTAIVSNLVDGATNVVTVTVTNNLGVTASDSVKIFRMWVPKPGDVQSFEASRGADYGQMQLSWSNGSITVLACTNRLYSTNATDWFALASGVSTPWTHTAASNFPSVYYRIVSGSYTSQYAVGKYDINIAPGSIAWLSFPFGVQPGCDIVSEWFGQQLEPRYNSAYDFPSLQRQSSPGGTIEYSDYYIADLGNGATNWFPTNTVVANAGYVLFLPQDHGAVKVTGIGMVQTNNVTMQLPYNSIPWVGLAYDVVMDMRQSGLTNMLQPPRLYSSFNYDFVDSQQTPGGPIWYAEYYRDNWGAGSINFFPSATGADKFEPGKGYLLFFSTTRTGTGTGTWTCVKPY